MTGPQHDSSDSWHVNKRPSCSTAALATTTAHSARAHRQGSQSCGHVTLLQSVVSACQRIRLCCATGVSPSCAPAQAPRECPGGARVLQSAHVLSSHPCCAHARLPMPAACTAPQATFPCPASSDAATQTMCSVSTTSRPGRVQGTVSAPAWNSDKQPGHPQAR